MTIESVLSAQCLTRLGQAKISAFRELCVQPVAGRSREKSEILQSQRDCVLQPRVAGGEVFNPNGVVSRFHKKAAAPLGLLPGVADSQGSSFFATLGWEPESLWDSTSEFPKGIIFNLVNQVMP